MLTGKSVIFLFLHGGPSQFETFDPKMAAPPDIRSASGEMATSIPGMTFGGNCRSWPGWPIDWRSSGRSPPATRNHDIKPVASRASGGANLGSLFARMAGATDPATGCRPARCSIHGPSILSTGPQTTSFGRLEGTGGAGAGFAPFVPGGGGSLEDDMRLNLPIDRLDDRRAMLAELDRVRFAFDAASGVAAVDRLREQAFQTVLGGVAKAFDLSREDPQTIARYDTAPLVRPEAISSQWNNRRHYVDNAKSLGRLLLLARRLCEAGCGLVTVTTNFVWDMHADQNNAGVAEGMRYTGPPLDHAVSALVEDLAARGLTDKILLVCAARWGGRQRSTSVAAVTTGATWRRCCWPAAGCAAGK